MITDPRTAPETARGRRIYSIAIGLLGALLIAPMASEYWAKVALLASLTIICAARPVILLSREAIARRERAGPRAPAPVGARPHRRARRRGVRRAPRRGRHAGAIGCRPRPAARSRPTSPSRSSTPPTSSRSRRSWGVRSPASRSRRSRRRLSDYRVAAVDLRLAPGGRPGAADGGGDADAARSRRAARRRPFKRVLDLALTHGRFVIVGEGGTALQPAAPGSQPTYASQPKGVGAFRKLRLVNVAPKVGLDFRQGAFRYSMAYDQQAMMGGGVCWLDYNNDGWLDLFAVNSYADVDMPEWAEHGGLPRERALPERPRQVRRRQQGRACRPPGEGRRAASPPT